MFVWLACASCQPVPAAEGPRDCEKDGDCVVTQHTGCCGCCHCGTPYAISVDDLRQLQSRCARVDCGPPKCDGVTCDACVDTSKMRAVCKAGQCELQR
jgi:hypothetical protein